MYNKMDKELNDTIKSAYPENSEEIKRKLRKTVVETYLN